LAVSEPALLLIVLQIAVHQEKGDKKGAVMARPRSASKSGGKERASATLMIRLDETSKKYVTSAAQLRRISISDYVRAITVAQARREVEAAREQIVTLTAEEQLAFWNALNEPVKLSKAQRRLGSMMRGES
jgi:uncharacterized protein (DUF1778 family)